MRALSRAIRAFRRCREGAAAIEFAFVMPVMLVISMGALDASLLMYEMHNGSEATRRGAREAVVLLYTLVDPADIVGTTIDCTSDGSTVTCSSGTVRSDAQTLFTKILNSMKTVLPQLTAADVTVSYSDSGISNGGVVTPDVTVRIDNVTYDLIVGHLWTVEAQGVELPSFRTTRVMNPTF